MVAGDVRTTTSFGAAYGRLSSADENRTALRYAPDPETEQVTRDYFQTDMEVLEFGCGTGSTAISHAPYVKHIHALDISSKMIEIARGKADANNGENVTFERSTIDEFNVSDQSLDAVLGLSILHLLDNKEEVIAKVHKMLKPGGIFITSTVCLGDTMMRFLEFVVSIGKFFGLMPRVKAFTTKDFQHSFSEVGFEIDYQWHPGKG